MKLKFTKEEMEFLNAIYDIEVNAEGVNTYSMKPMVINDEGETQVELVKFIQSINNSLFDEMIKNGVSLNSQLHLEGIMYDVCAIDYVNKKIAVRRGDNSIFDYFELIKNNQ